MGSRIQRIAAVDLAQKTGTPAANILNTRYFGRQFFTVLVERMQALPCDNAVELSLHGIDVIDASFADEVFGTLISQRIQDDVTLPPLYLADVTDSHRDNLEYTLVSRPERQKGLRNCVVPVKLPSDDLVLVGKYEDNFKQTFDLLRALKQLTTRQVVDAMRLTPQAASSRLKALYDLGIAFRHEVRDEQGKQFIYRWLL